MRSTLARKKFKRKIGQENQYLITVRVGLWAIRDCPDLFEVPDEMRAQWSPKDKKCSAERSEKYAMQSFLAWAVDCLDMYMTLINRKPCLLVNQELKSKFDHKENSRSVHKKTFLLADYYKVDQLYVALTDVLITWRNNVFHSANSIKLKESSVKTIMREKDRLIEEFCGLDPEGVERGGMKKGLCWKAENGGDLTFKETASLIRAVQCFVQNLDEKIIAELEKPSSADGLTHAGNIVAELAAQAMREDRGFRKKIGKLTPERRRSFVAKWAESEYGLSGFDDKELDIILNKIIEKKQRGD